MLVFDFGRNKPPRASIRGCLRQAVKNGLRPNTVIDVGVAYETQALYDVFKYAKFILIEPVKEFVPHLENIVSRLNDAEFILAAASNERGDTIINVHPDLVGSSLYKEEENSDVNGVERTVPVVTLDDLCRERNTRGPYLIKIDTQGSEIDVLMGAETVLQETEFVILEVSLFEFFRNGPQIYDYITFMKDRGFVPYDIFDLQYRPLDGAMSQIDMAFVRENGHLRRYHFYATREQRREQNKSLTKRR